MGFTTSKEVLFIGQCFDKKVWLVNLDLQYIVFIYFGLIGLGFRIYMRTRSLGFGELCTLDIQVPRYRRSLASPS